MSGATQGDPSHHWNGNQRSCFDAAFFAVFECFGFSEFIFCSALPCSCYQRTRLLQAWSATSPVEIFSTCLAHHRIVGSKRQANVILEVCFAVERSRERIRVDFRFHGVLNQLCTVHHTMFLNRWNVRSISEINSFVIPFWRSLATFVVDGAFGSAGLPLSFVHLRSYRARGLCCGHTTLECAR